MSESNIALSDHGSSFLPLETLVYSYLGFSSDPCTHANCFMGEEKIILLLVCVFLAHLHLKSK